ncbi:MAG: type II toxin-antitoxin system ParD family antitoxin [Cyanobacteria bacterium P01_F01_bin.143]
MSTLNISLPESMQEFINHQIKQGGYSTASDYIRDLIQQDQEKTEKKQVEQLLLEGLNSGKKIEVTDDWWSHKKATLVQSLDKSES